MATSGTMNGNGLTVGGQGNQHFFINWQLAGQNIGGNYSTINWQAYMHFQGADAQLDNGVANLGGATRWANGGRVYNYAGNFSTRDLLLASGSFNIGHNSDGNQTLGVDGGVTVYQTGRTQGSAAWGLPTIPRHAVMNWANDFNDEQQLVFNYSNPAGTGVDFYIETPNNGGSAFAGRNLGGGGGGTVGITLDSTELGILRGRMPNSNSMVVRYVIHDTLGGNNSWSFLDRTCTIVNGQPVFTTSQVSYLDTNSTTTAITGDNQVIVQNQSTMQVNYTAASAVKGASISSYRITVNGDVRTQSGTTAINYSALDISVDTPIQVEAIDSRGNITSAIITASVAAWQLPRAVLTVGRVNNYEDNTNVTANVTIDPVNGGNSIQVLKASTKKIADPTYTDHTLTNNTLSVISLDKAFEWNLRITVTDKFGTTTYNMIVQKGQPIMFMDSSLLSIGIGKFPTGTDTLEIADAYMAGFIKQLYPIGRLIQTSVNTNPGTLAQFAGTTWTARSTTVVNSVTFYNFERTA